MTDSSRPASLYRSLNPANGETFATYALHEATEVDAGLARSFAAWQAVRAMSVEQRARLERRFAVLQTHR